MARGAGARDDHVEKLVLVHAEVPAEDAARAPELLLLGVAQHVELVPLSVDLVGGEHCRQGKDDEVARREDAHRELEEGEGGNEGTKAKKSLRKLLVK